MALAKSKIFAALAAVIAIGACGRAANNEFSNAQSNMETAGGVNAGQAEETNASSATPNESVSSGMPVPGTNTPEHVVVNEDNIVNTM